MRILYIVTAFPRSPEDVITPWLSETIERLGRRGIEVEVLAPSYRGLGDQTIGGIRVHRFRYAPARVETLTHDQTTPDRLRERPYYLALLPGYLVAGTLAAVRLARSGRFDVIHAFWPLPHGVFGLAARRLSGVPLISTFFGVELTWLRRQLPFLSPVVRAIVRGSDAVTVISSHTERELRTLTPGAEVRVIPFGAASGGTPSGATRVRTEGPYELLFVGRLVERKGVEILLRALRLVPTRESIHLTIVGDGPLRGNLERLADELGVAGRVDFRGVVGREELGRHFEACDAFILPAVEDGKGDVEGLGVVLIEALTHGKPVIASRSGGIPDIVENGRTGLLVEPGDPEGLAAAILTLRSDPELSAELAHGGREHVMTRFSWDAIIDQLAALYGEVAAGVDAPAPAAGVGG